MLYLILFTICCSLYCRVIYHSGFFLTELLILGCMLSLFSVVLFGLDGALISFESMQWVCKVR